MQDAQNDLERTFEPTRLLKMRYTTHTKPFPDHCEKTASAMIIRKRLRFPGVVSKLIHPNFEAAARSKLMAALIS